MVCSFVWHGSSSSLNNYNSRDVSLYFASSSKVRRRRHNWGIPKSLQTIKMCCLINVLYCLENVFVRCRLHMYIWLLGASPPDPHRGSAPGPRWETSVPRPPVPTLPPNPGYATVQDRTAVLVWRISAQRSSAGRSAPAGVGCSHWPAGKRNIVSRLHGPVGL